MPPKLLSRLPRTQHAPYLLHRRDDLASTRSSTLNRFVISRWRLSSLRPMTKLAEEDFDHFNYTSGRWLRQDALQQKARYIRFDFDALRRRVIALCPGANHITSYSKKEGGYNRVFIFHLDNAKRVVGKLPFSVTGPRSLTTNSEVATIQFIQTKTSIPIPKILEWSDDTLNAIGSEYIIMEHAPGVSLHERWPTMDVDEQIRCVRAICEKSKELIDINLPAYGSLYFAATPSIAARLLPLEQGFGIGPHCGAMYWDCNVGQSRHYHDVDPNQGPWSDLSAYCKGLIDTGVARLPPADLFPQQPRFLGSIQEHRQLLEQGRAVISKMATDPRIQKVAVPTIFHPDLHRRNIFVSEEDPTNITAIIDWQSSSIEPAFWYADEIPDFAQPILDPSDEERVDPKSEACAQAFDACIRFLAPKLASARSMDENLFRPFRYCHRTWQDGAVAFREELIQTKLHWDQLGLMGPCPFDLPSSDELGRHQQDYRRFEAAQQLKYSLSDLLHTASDGWMPPEQWETTKSAHQELFAEMLHEVVGIEQPDDDEPIKTEADLREIWPFDL